jgi:hypothetical protein
LHRTIIWIIVLSCHRPLPFITISIFDRLSIGLVTMIDVVFGCVPQNFDTVVGCGQTYWDQSIVVIVLYSIVIIEQHRFHFSLDKLSSIQTAACVIQHNRLLKA